MVALVIFAVITVLVVAVRRSGRSSPSAPPSQPAPPTRSPRSPAPRTPPTVRSTPFVGGAPKGTTQRLPLSSPDHHRVVAVLRRASDLSAAQIAAAVNQEFGLQWDKSKANSVIYRMERMGLVTKRLQGKRPHWSLVE